MHKDVTIDKHAHKALTIVLALDENWYSFAPLLASLEKNADVLRLTDVVICKTLKEYMMEIRRRGNLYDKILVLLSFFTTQISEITLIFRETNLMRRHLNENILLICGGPHPSGDPIKTLKLGADVVVRGEGEYILPPLLRAIIIGEPLRESLRNIAEVICIDNSNKFVISPSVMVNLDEVSPYSSKWNLHPPIEISRGCPFGCKYCEVSYIFGKKMRHRSVDSIERIAKHYIARGLTDLRFISSNSFAYGSRNGVRPNPQKVIKLLRRLHALNGEKRIFFGTFPSEVRPDFVMPELVDAVVKYCNNRKIAVGAQSGSERVLRAIGRGHDVDCVYSAVDIIRERGLIPVVDVIFGLPPESPEDQMATLDLVKNLISSGAEVRVHYFMPLAGTPYAYATPKPLLDAVRKELRRLTGSGKVRGAWELQERISWYLVRWREHTSSEGVNGGAHTEQVTISFHESKRNA
ncbi:MAG: TIGR04013 family B12-binding domain/radical SAM domain-containing protein [Candidatus Baldrarchaeia archaeon]